MSQVKQGIAIAGTLISDVFYDLDSYPEQGCLSRVRGMSRSIGGTGNIILDLAKLDSQLTVKVCALIGKTRRGMLCKKCFQNTRILIWRTLPYKEKPPQRLS